MKPLIPVCLVFALIAGCSSTLPTVQVAQTELAMPQELPALRDADVEHSGIALCLSGGGYRATLFHLGVVWRLNEAGLLPRLESLSGVSGGAIFAALLGARWDQLEFDGNTVTPASFEREIVTPVLALTGSSIDTSAVLASVNPFVSNPLPDFYDSNLFQGAELTDLPRPGEGPIVELHATELSLGYSWYFYRDRVGSPSVGFVPNPKILLADIVTASTAVPGVFEPVYLDLDKSLMRFRSPEVEVREAISRVQWDISQDEAAIQTARGENQLDVDGLWAELKSLREQARGEMRVPVQLVDGGVLDNFASNACQNSERSIVSDATINTQIEAATYGSSRFAIAMRSIDVMGNLNARNLSKELFRRSLALASKPICSDSADEQCTEPFFTYIALTQGMPKNIEGLREKDYELNRIARLPTRLAELTRDEQAALVNWGYVAAEGALRKNRPLQKYFVANDVAPFTLPLDGGSVADE